MKSSNNPLITACKNNNLPQLKKLLQSGFVDTINWQDQFGNTALHIAAYGNAIKIAETLLKYGINPNIKNFYGQTALNIAVASKNHSMISVLLTFKLNDELSRKTKIPPMFEVFRKQEELNLISLLQNSPVPAIAPNPNAFRYPPSSGLWSYYQPPIDMIYLALNGILMGVKNDLSEIKKLLSFNSTTQINMQDKLLSCKNRNKNKSLFQDALDYIKNVGKADDDALTLLSNPNATKNDLKVFLQQNCKPYKLNKFFDATECKMQSYFIQKRGISHACHFTNHNNISVTAPKGLSIYEAFKNKFGSSLLLCKMLNNAFITPEVKQKVASMLCCVHIAFNKYTGCKIPKNIDILLLESFWEERENFMTR